MIYKKITDIPKEYQFIIEKLIVNEFIYCNSPYSPDATMPDTNKMLSGTAEILGRREAEIVSVEPIKKHLLNIGFGIG